MQYLIAIDPSINNLGFADLQIDDKGKPTWFTELLNPEGSLQRRVKYICHHYILKRIRKIGNHPHNLIMEMPTFMTGSKGLIAAQKGYTIDLAYIIGAIQGMLDLSPLNVFLYTPQQWKGQKPKSATKAQHKRIFGFDLPSQDECDAKMMLYFHCKKFNLI